MRRRAMGDEMGLLTWAISPSGLRTATAQLEGLRIITPSRTACPPMALNSALAGAGALEAALEALDATAGIDQLLLAGVEGMASGADLDVQLGLRRARDDHVAAGDERNDPLAGLERDLAGQESGGGRGSGRLTGELRARVQEAQAARDL